MGSKTIESLDRRGKLGGFDNNQTMDILQGLQDEIKIILVGRGEGGGGILRIER